VKNGVSLSQRRTRRWLQRCVRQHGHNHALIDKSEKNKNNNAAAAANINAVMARERGLENSCINPPQTRMKTDSNSTNAMSGANA
jgi:hypothetical protein